MKRKKIENILDVKITKWSRAFKGYSSSYNVEMLNELMLDLQLKDTDSVIKKKLN